MTRRPADIGTPADQIDTPALVVDLDAYEKNLDRITVVVALIFGFTTLGLAFLL